MTKKVFSILVISMLCLAPVTILAVDFGTPPVVQTNANPNAGTFISNLLGILLDLIWIIFVAFAIIMFIVAGFQFLGAQGEPDGVKKARNSLIWGAIGVAIAVTAFTIPFFIRNTVIPAATCNPACEPGFVCTNGTCFVGGGGI